MAQSPLFSRAFDDGTRLARAGDFAGALSSYRTAHAIRSGDMPDAYAAKIHFNIGVCEYRLGNLPDAVSELGRAVRLSRGTYQRAYYALGMAESGRNDWPRARRAFLEAVKLNAADAEAWFDLGIVYLAEHDHDNAGLAFQNSVQYESTDSALGHNNIGVILAMKSDLAGAEREFEAAVYASDGGLPEAKRNLEFCRQLLIRRAGLVASAGFRFAARRSG